MADLPKFQRAQYEFAAHIRNPQTAPCPPGLEDRRLAIYRDLFYNNVEGFLARSFPVIRKLFSAEKWHSMARDFFARHRSHSPFFLDIPKEFLHYLENERDNASDPPFLLELAHYEWAELAISILDEEPDAVQVNVDGDLLEGIPVLSPTAWSLAYHFPVHQIKPDFQPQEAGESFTFLVVYRNRKDAVGFLEINPVTARLIELIGTNDASSGREMLLQIATEISHPHPAAVVSGGADILTNLADHDIILGTRTH